MAQKKRRTNCIAMVVPLAPLLLAGVSTSALAQGAGYSSEVEEVIVTAQKRSENLQTVAVAVSALDTQTLSRAGISTVNDVALKVPSLNVTESIPTQVSYKIRGLGNEADITTFEPEVALFFDGAYRIKAPFGAADLIDVERIEVLRGPQPSLYGKNATAGVVNVVTAAPSQERSSAFDVDVNQYRVRSRGFVNGGLGEGVAGRLSYFVTKGIDTLQESIGPDKAGGYAGTQYGFRPQLSFTPTDRFSLRLIGGYAHRDMRPSTPTALISPADVAVYNAVASNPRGLAARDVDGLTDGVTNPGAEPVDPRILAPGANRNDVTQNCGGCSYVAVVTTADVTAIADYDIGGATITSITSYDYYKGRVGVNASQAPVDFGPYRKREDSKSFSQELRISSNDSASSLKWLLGGYYYWNKVTQTINIFNGPAMDEYGIAAFGTTRVYGLPGDSVTEPASSESRLAAVFGNASYAITDQLSVKAGLRYASEKKHAIAEPSVFSFNPRGLGTSLVMFVSAGTFDLQDRFEHLSGDATVQYQVTPDVMLYGTYATAYKSGGFNIGIAADATNSPYAPEKVKSLELGMKGLFFDRRLRLNLSAFHTLVDDYQAGAFEGFRYGVDNADAETNGAELDMLAKLGAGFSLDGNFAYVDAHYRTFTSGACYPGNPTATPAGCDLSGRTLPYSAKFRGSIGLSYEADNGVYGRIDQFYTTKYNANTNLDPRSVQKAYGLTNARVGWRKNNLDVSAYVQNLFDKVYVQFEAAAPASLGPGLQTYLAGHRQVGATARVNF
jgi:iron complex outermembrane recepter protein